MSSDSLCATLTNDLGTGVSLVELVADAVTVPPWYAEMAVVA